MTATNGSGSNVWDSYFFEVRPLTLNQSSKPDVRVTPKFTWNAIPGASRYDIWVYADGSAIRSDRPSESVRDFVVV